MDTNKSEDYFLSSGARLVRLRDGRSITLAGEVWTIESGAAKFIFDWNNAGVPAGLHRMFLKDWIAYSLQRNAVSSCANKFKFIMIFTSTAAFINAAKNNQEIPFLAFSQASNGLTNDSRWKMHYAREFYRWCVRKSKPYYSEDVLARAEALVVGGNAKGKAVRSEDPDAGPLTELEVQSLCAALRAAYIEKTLSLRDQVAVLLCLAFGANASQYAMMREDDIEFIYEDGILIATLVRVSRHKKSGRGPRDEFKTRKLNKTISSILLEYIASNSDRKINSEAGQKRPLFWSKIPKSKSTDMIEWTWHIAPGAFTSIVQNAVQKLGSISRKGEPLKVSTRRFRYTFATRLLQEGASPYAVAAALDHSDLQNVQTYTHLSSGILDHINPAVARELGERAQAFTHIVASEADAVNGDKRSSRRYFGDRSRDIFEPIGNCGHNALCNVAAPLACYVCPKFQPWLDGPHEMVLQNLIDRREQRKSTSSDMRMVGLEDEILVAVANVVTRVDAIRQSAS